MKKSMSIILIIILMIIVCSCKKISKEQTAQLLIKEMLSNTMVYPDSYKSVSFGSLDSLYSCIEDDSVYKVSKKVLTNMTAQKLKIEKDLARNKKSMDNLNQLRTFAVVHTPYLDNRRMELNKRLNKCNSKIDSIKYCIDSMEIHFKPLFVGYTMEHRFQYLSRINVKREDTAIFYFDPDMSFVIKFKDDQGLLFEYNKVTNKYELK